MGADMIASLEFVHIPGDYAIVRLPQASHDADWAKRPFAAMIWSGDGLTMICRADCVPAGSEMRHGFRCIAVAGRFALNSVGIVAAAVAPLAAAGISVFVYSTWETDYILIPEADLAAAINALLAAGHRVAAAPE